jgi:putrescine transport system permease protein
VRNATDGAVGKLALAGVLLFLHAPLLLVALFSFSAGRSTTAWGGFSTIWYETLWQDGPLLDAAAISLQAAFLSALAATGLGTIAALAMTRRRSRAASFVQAAIYAPLVTPDVIAGLSLLLLMVALGLDRGFWTLVLAHTAVTTSYVAVLVRAKLVTLPPLLREAAADLGASPAAAFWTVTLPLAGPAVGAGFLLAFTLSLDDVVVASFTAGPGSTTLPMRIFSQLHTGVTPEINAVSTLLVVAAAAAVAVATLVSGRAGRRGQATG